MTTGKTHLIIFVIIILALLGVAYYYQVLLPLQSLLNPATIILMLIVGGIGALFPDIDIGTSSIRRLVSIFAILALLWAFGMYYFAHSTNWLGFGVGLLIFLLWLQFQHHRRFCHSFVFMMLTTIGVFALFYWISLPYANPFLMSGAWFLGFFLHLSADKELRGWLT